MDGPIPDYYATLGVASTATSDEIRQAYKRESLRSHPDRFPNSTASERQRHTARFQSLADAYYVLSDTTRRAEYDSLRRSQSFGSYSSTPPGGFTTDPEKEQESSYNFFKSFFGGAAGGGGGGSAAPDSSTGSPHAGSQPQAGNVFSDVFEELLRPEVHRVVPLWTWVGSASGAGLGFIVGNIPGAIGGAVLGNRLGLIRDRKGKSVGEVFVGLGASQRAEVLKALAAKVLGSMG